MKMTTQIDLLSLFGGSEENVKYYLELKSCVQALRANGEPICGWDPRDIKMRERIQETKWKPTLIEKLLKTEGSCGENFSISNKQVALEDGGNESYEDENNKGCGDAEGGKRKLGAERNNESQFVCGVQGCSQIFSTLASYESHYHMCHNYECTNCKRSFVSNFLLDLHLQENHDSYFQILCSRIDMYRCLIESCDLKFRTPEQRKDHLVVHHKFPASFSFHQPLKPRLKTEKTQKNMPSKNKPSTDTMETEIVECHETSGPRESREKSGRKKKSKVKTTKSEATNEQMECEVTMADVSMATKTNTSGSGKRGRGGRGGNRVPPTICFGRGSQRTFQARGRGRHWHQMNQQGDTTVDIEKMDFKDIGEALDG